MATHSTHCLNVSKNRASGYPANRIIDTCSGCNRCRKECAFLTRYGNPGRIAQLSRTDPDTWQAISFECSLCELCTAVCPNKLEIPALFLQLRNQAFESGKGCFPEHDGILGYEKKGTSRWLTWYSLRENCDTIFFPGCTLTGTRPATTKRTFEYLQADIENIGCVLDCCTKPSHDLGRLEHFDAMFSEMETFLQGNGIRTVIVACPNCHKIFTTHGKAFEVKTVYEVMAENKIQPEMSLDGSVTIHDPCPVRFNKSVHDSTRALVRSTGLSVIDTPHCRKKTVCCGEGGAVGCLVPELSTAWTVKRVRESGRMKIASYCAGCVGFLSKKTDAFHVLDLIFDPDKTMKGRARAAKAPFTYLNRLKLKRDLKKQPAAITRERLFSPGREKKKRAALVKLMLFFLVTAGVAGARFFL